MLFSIFVRLLTLCTPSCSLLKHTYAYTCHTVRAATFGLQLLDMQDKQLDQLPLLLPLILLPIVPFGEDEGAPKIMCIAAEPPFLI